MIHTMDEPQISTFIKQAAGSQLPVPDMDDSPRRTGDNDRVGRHEGLREPPVVAEPADGEHLFQPLPQRVRGAGVGLVEQPGQVLGVAQADVGVGVVEGLHQLGVDPRLLLLGQVIGNVAPLVQLMPISA